MEKRNIKISVILNIIIVLFTIFASIIMFTDFKFMEGGVNLESTKIGKFKLFTVDSNIFMGVISLIFLIKEIKYLKDENKVISTKMYILKLMATVGVAITFITVFTYLGQIAEGGIYSLITNSNLFFHLLIPGFSIITFIFFEKTNLIKLRYVILGILPVIFYSIFYISNILVHIENGKVSPEYDWYWFVQGGIWQVAIVAPVMLLAAYLVSVVLWRLNKKK